jgi:hypothetical protein
MKKEQIKKDLKKLFKSMDFISENFLNKEFLPGINPPTATREP